MCESCVNLKGFFLGEIRSEFYFLEITNKYKLYLSSLSQAFLVVGPTLPVIKVLMMLLSLVVMVSLVCDSDF